MKSLLKKKACLHEYEVYFVAILRLLLRFVSVCALRFIAFIIICCFATPCNSFTFIAYMFFIYLRQILVEKKEEKIPFRMRLFSQKER